MFVKISYNKKNAEGGIVVKGISLRKKLLGIFLLIGIIPVTILGIYVFYTYSNILKNEARIRIISLQKLKKRNIENYFDNLVKSAELVADGMELEDFEYGKIDSFINKEEYVDYLENYVKSHFPDINYLYDMFIIDDDGNIIFAFNDHLIGINLMEKEYSSYNLTDFYGYIKTTGETHIRDIKPSDFLSGEYEILIGCVNSGYVVIFSIDPAIVDYIVSPRYGLGKTGETYVIGLDSDGKFSLRSDRVVKEGKVGEREKDPYIENAILYLKSGYGITEDKEFIVYGPLMIRNLNWGIFTTVSLSEIYYPVHIFRTYTFIFIAVISIIIVIVGIGFGNRITVPILNLINALEEVKKGKRDIKINVNYKDEVGTLIGSFNSMLRELKEKEEKLESENRRFISIFESLKNAVKGKKVNIRKIKKEDDIGKYTVEILELINESVELRNSVEYIREGEKQFSENILGEKKLYAVCDKGLSFIVEYVKGICGAIYVRDENYYNLIYSYGLEFDNLPTRIERISEIVRKLIRIKKLYEINSSEYLRIKSSLSLITISNIVIMPLIFENELVGFIEIGKSSKFDDKEREFLSDISSQFAAIISSVIYSVKLEELLIKTQSQAEELEASEEELRAINEELRRNTQILEEQKKELEKKNKEINRINKYKTEFLANISHELRTPLNSILLLTSVLLKDDKGNLTDDQKEILKTINKSGKNLLSLINNILDISKIEAGEIDINKESIKVKYLKEDIEREFDIIAKEKGIKFEVFLPENIENNIIEIDIQKVKQIIRNLINNAIKFTDEGKVEVRIDIKNDELIVEVEDTGIGIKESDIPTIFDMFKQVDGSTKRSYEGTGLGLSIVKKLVELMNGSISVKSQYGKGSMFRVVIPLKEKCYDENVILVIEDNEEFSFMLSEVIRDSGYNPKVFSNGREGFLYALYNDVKGVILDVKLPDINGVKVLEEFKYNTKTRHIPVYVFSFYDEFEKEFLKKGAVSFIKKPVDIETVKHVIAEINKKISKKKEVLIIDDDVYVIDAIRSIISNEDIDIYVSDSVVRSKNIIKNNDIDVIIIDVGLNNGKGWEVIKFVKDIGKEIPTIIYTGKDIISMDKICKERMIIDVLRKGYDNINKVVADVLLFVHRIGNDDIGDKLIIRDIIPNPIKNKKILIVDDDVEMINMLSRILKEEGADVIKSYSGEEALKYVNNDIDIILMDIMMPGMDGYTTVKKIRKKGYRNPIIAVTARVTTFDREEALKNGYDDFISKPIDIDKLISLIRIWI